MVGGKYNVLLFAEHGLYPPKMELKEGLHNMIYISMDGNYTSLSYNTHNSDNVTLNQNTRTGVTLAAKMKYRMGSKRWTLTSWEDRHGLGLTAKLMKLLFCFCIPTLEEC